MSVARAAALPLQVGVGVVEAVELGQVHQHAGGTAAIPRPAEAAVADPSAGRALPLLSRGGQQALRELRLHSGHLANALIHSDSQ